MMRFLIWINLFFICPAMANLAPHCTVSFTPTAFGIYDTFSLTPNDSAGNMHISCTGHGSVSFDISLSAGSSNNFSMRQMPGSSCPDKLAYNIYLDASRVSIWGNGTGGSVPFILGNVTVNGTYSLNVPVYARIPAGQKVSVDIYGETLLATLNY